MARVRKNWWRAPRNPAATHYVYQNDRVVDRERFTLLAIALEMPRACTSTKPMLLTPLMKWTRLTEQQVRIHRKKLVEMGEIACHQVKGTKRVRYEMLKLAGPLFVVNGDQDPKKTFGSLYGQHPKETFGSLPLSSFKQASTTSRSPAAPDPAAAAVAVLKMHELIDWWRAEFPGFHDGRPSGIDVTTDADVVLDLFARGQPVDVVQSAAIELWTMKPDGNPRSDRTFCATSDHNVRVLRRKQRFLEGEVDRRATAALPGNVWGQVLERIERKMDRHTFHTWLRDTVLVEDCGDVIEVGAVTEDQASFIRKHHSEIIGEATEQERPGARVEIVALLAGDASRAEAG